nr:MAG TPA: hypothetical protein [Caudoviricetes sp.]
MISYQIMLIFKIWYSFWYSMFLKTLYTKDTPLY